MSLSGSLTAGYWYADNGQSRGYTLSWSATQSIANNQSTITWWVDTAGTYPYQVAERTLVVTLAGHTLINKSDRVMRGAGRVASGSFTVNHDSVGNKSISGSITAAVYTSAVNCSNSCSWNLDQIPRAASISSSPNFDDEGNPTITYSNPAGNSVSSLDACISFTGAKDDIPYRSISKTGTSYTFQLTDDERKTLRLATTGSNSRKVIFHVRTIIGGNTYYSTQERTLTIINGTPTLEPSVVDVNEATIALTGDANILIRNFSEASVESNAGVYKEATIESQRVICGSKSLNSGSGIIDGVGSGSFIFSITDNRKNTVSSTVNVPFIEYVNLTCNINAKSPNAEGEFDFSVIGNYFAGSFGAVDNTIEVFYRYKTDGDEYCDWIKIEDISVNENDNTYTANVSLSGLDYRARYTFQAMSFDALIEIESVERIVKTVPVFDWGEKDFNFNVPVFIQGHALDDYVVEQGMDGIWTYRKWASGIAECFGLHSITAESTGNIATTVDYPFEWDSSNGYPIVLLTPGYNATLYSYVKNCDAAGNRSDPFKKCDLLYMGVNGTSYSFGCNIHVIGRWKGQE